MRETLLEVRAFLQTGNCLTTRDQRTMGCHYCCKLWSFQDFLTCETIGEPQISKGTVSGTFEIWRRL